MYLSVKRFFDVLIAICLLPFVLLVILISAFFIKIEDGGPVFYLGKRIGKNGKIFKMIKLRSMYVNAPDIRLEDGSTYNSSDDDRVTKFGRVARKTSIDELPQIINVLIGDMSFIGPRPDTDKYLYHYEECPEDKKVLSVRPGITGYNQVINRNDSNAEIKMKCDKYYVDNISFILDCKILIKTITVVMGQKNIWIMMLWRQQLMKRQKQLLLWI